mmetsp:Transcript_32632/g.109909  ORF Transcript_32632/g.109909 Transcript_32632/m.109909 type:complete len:478 (-) Transcript_32632:703-2136(-)
MSDGGRLTTSEIKSLHFEALRTSSQVKTALRDGSKRPRRMTTTSRVRLTTRGGLRMARTSSSCCRLMPRTALRASNRAGSAFASSTSADALRASMATDRTASSSDSAEASLWRCSACCWSATMAFNCSAAMPSCADRRACCDASSPCMPATDARAAASSRRPSVLRRCADSKASFFAVASVFHTFTSSTKSRADAVNVAGNNPLEQSAICACTSTSAATTASRKVHSRSLESSSSSCVRADPASSALEQAALPLESRRRNLSAQSESPIVPKSTVLRSESATWARAFGDHLPNQSTTHLLKSAGDAVACASSVALFVPGLSVSTTWRFFRTRFANHSSTAASLSSPTPSFADALDDADRLARQAERSLASSSAGQRPATSPAARRAFIRSRNADDTLSASSMIRQSFSASTPARRIAARSSSSKSASVYVRVVWISTTAMPAFQATNFVKTLFPTPLSPTIKRWPDSARRTLSILKA